MPSGWSTVAERVLLSPFISLRVLCIKEFILQAAEIGAHRNRDWARNSWLLGPTSEKLLAMLVTAGVV